MSEATSMEASEILPLDCWESIFSHLPDDALKAVSLVCKDFLTISNAYKHSLPDIHPILMAMFSKLLVRFKHIQEININVEQLGGYFDKAILEIARSEMKCLKALICNKIHPFSDDGLGLIANSFPNLEELWLGNPCICCYSHKLPTDYGVEYLASKLKFLKRIRIPAYISDQSVVALSVNCAFLKAVTIWSCCVMMKLTENCIGVLLRNSPNLEALKISDIKIFDSPDQSAITIENSISHAKALTSLTFTLMIVRDSLLNAIANAKLRLKKVKVRYCKNFTVSGLHMVLSKSDCLTKFCIIESLEPYFKDVDMQLLLNGSDLGNLTYIDISNCNVTFSSLFLLLSKCASLVKIVMNDTRLSDSDLHNVPLVVKSHKMIQHLDVSECSIGDKSLKQFALMFPNLRVLDLSSCSHITSIGIEHLFKSLKFMRKLVLHGYRGTKLFKTDNLELGEVNLEELTLKFSNIDDEGLAAIAKLCPRLVYLDLNCCIKMTVEGIKQIVKNIKTLNCLDMFGSYDSSLDLLNWMLCTGNLASLEKLYLTLEDEDHSISEEIRDKFLQHGCLLMPRFSSVGCA